MAIGYSEGEGAGPMDFQGMKTAAVLRFPGAKVRKLPLQKRAADQMRMGMMM
jgi:hypothetical protein